MNIRGLSGSPMKHIQQFQIERNPVATHNYVVCVQIAVVFAHIVYSFQSNSQSMKQVQSLESADAPAGLSGQKLREQLAFDVFGYQKGDFVSAELERILGVILDQDPVVAQLMKFLGIDPSSLSAHAAIREPPSARARRRSRLAEMSAISASAKNPSASRSTAMHARRKGTLTAVQARPSPSGKTGRRVRPSTTPARAIRTTRSTSRAPGSTRTRTTGVSG